MNFLKKIIIWIFLFFSIFSLQTANWESIDWLNNVRNTQIIIKDENIWETAKKTWYNIINWFRVVFSGILILFIVYAWIQMVMSMWTDDDSLSKAKRSLWYAIIWIIFINFPIDIYESIYWKSSSNLFINSNVFPKLLNNILTAMEILIWWIVIFILVLEWIKLIVKSREEEESFKNAKSKIRWVIIWLVFLWFIRVWKNFLISWSINEAWNIFNALANLALYIAWPTAIFFLCLAWYYYIFSNWDEDKAKKWKTIVINTSIWVILILCIYILLIDISLLKF